MPDLATIQTALMQFPVPCQCAKGPPEFSGPGIKGYADYPDCTCSGSGVRYPLRFPCPKCSTRVGGEDMWWAKCHECDDNKSIFNPDADALWDAVRAKGWRLEFKFQEHGDFVVIEAYVDWQYGKRWVGIGVCNPYQFGPDEGLRGQAALWTVLARTKERW